MSRPNDHVKFDGSLGQAMSVIRHVHCRKFTLYNFSRSFLGLPLAIYSGHHCHGDLLSKPSHLMLSCFLASIDTSNISFHSGLRRHD